MTIQTKRNRWTITVGSDLQVVGYNPERADMDNPRGEIIREVFRLEATNDYGDRRVTGAWRDAASAIAAYPVVPMVTEWTDTYPVYGSEAYEAYGEEEMLAWEARHQEWADLFPGDRYARF